MSFKTIAFFNNKGGVGKTSLLYHLAWMFRELGVKVLAVDLDPQSNLSAAFMQDEELEEFWPEGPHPRTILGAVSPLMEHEGDIAPVEAVRIADNLSLVVGDLGLGEFEERLSKGWADCLTDDRPVARDGFRVISAFHRIIAAARDRGGFEVALVDVGPSVGALNRAALVASDHVVIPLAADLFSLQGLRNLGRTLRKWREGWNERRVRRTVPPGLELPLGSMAPLGYVLMSPSMRQNRPVQAYARWGARIPAVYAHSILGSDAVLPSACLAEVKHFKSLMPMAQDARRPVFMLTGADGAIGGHAAAVRDTYALFEALAQRVVSDAGIRSEPIHRA
ncbi:MAG: ParA family protein [Deltaproteobacteria bacterium]|nr:ParA family protein [Deltaproteobacteria bacterium]